MVDPRITEEHQHAQNDVPEDFGELLEEHRR